MKKLDYRVAVVTGAASGIGRATSLELARHRCRLALADIDPTALDETRRLVERLRGATVSTHVVDVADPKRMQAFAQEVLDAHGSVGILVNNAGVTVSGNFQDHTLEDFEWVININLWGVVYGCRFFLPALLASGEGHIVNLSSVFGLVGMPMQTSYCASKFAVRGFSEALRSELAGAGVGVTSVHPGGVATNVATRGRFRGDEVARRRHDRTVDQFIKRGVPPEKVARAIVRGIQRNQPRVLVAPEAYWLDFAKRVFPAATDRLVEWGYRYG